MAVPGFYAKWEELSFRTILQGETGLPERQIRFVIKVEKQREM
jgi:hypothetical protein